MINNPEQPEPELTRDERRELRQRLRVVRRERRKLATQRAKANKMESKGKGDKKRK
jgi:Trp operon repressor